MPAAVDGLKQCSKCAETKPVSEYSKDNSKSDGLQYVCRSCEKKYRQNNKEHISKRQKEYYEVNKERILKRKKEHYETNKEYILEREKRYREANKERIRKRDKEYYQKSLAAVYKIENTVTGKIYIGQSKSYSWRWHSHRSLMKDGRHRNPYLQHDYDAYGEDSFDFSVIQEYPCDTDSDILFEHEQRLIEEYLAEGKELYNINRYN